jgi:hypothetical protein
MPREKGTKRVPPKGKKAARKVLAVLEAAQADIPALMNETPVPHKFTRNSAEANAFIMTDGESPTGSNPYTRAGKRHPLDLYRHLRENEMERPSDDLKREICNFVLGGVPVDTAFMACGVSITAYRQWLHSAQQALDTSIHDDFRELFESVSIAVAQAQATMFFEARMDPANTIDLLKMRWPSIFGKHAGATPDNLLDYTKQVLSETSADEMAYTLSIFQQVNMAVGGTGETVDITAEPAEEPKKEKITV